MRSARSPLRDHRDFRGDEAGEEQRPSVVAVARVRRTEEGYKPLKESPVSESHFDATKRPAAGC
jgi:hypothetical protein